MKRIVKVKNPSSDQLIGDRIELANNSWTRLVGLLGRKGLDAGAGLWIRPCSGVHTLGMSFPIDVIGLDKNLKVVSLWSSLVPQRLTKVNFKMASVVELPAGRIRECGVEVGQTLTIEPVRT